MIEKSRFNIVVIAILLLTVTSHIYTDMGKYVIVNFIANKGQRVITKDRNFLIFPTKKELCIKGYSIYEVSNLNVSAIHIQIKEKIVISNIFSIRTTDFISDVFESEDACYEIS